MRLLMIKIANHEIGPQNPPFIIAELSANHNGDIDLAKKSIRAAKKAGASAVKIQTYTPETMTINCSKTDFRIETGLWKGYTLYDLYKIAHTPYEWHEELFKEARECNLTILSTPFDNTAVELLENLGCPAYKIASFEITDIPLLKCAAKTGKPIILSTGMATLGEIKEAIKAIQSENNNQIILLHCISSYPALTTDSKLGNINFLKEEFDYVLGLSDHTTNSVAAICSIAQGASLIEKHFTIDRNIGGPDSSFSLQPEEFKSMVKDVNSAWSAISNLEFERSVQEVSNRQFRRSLYFVENLEPGDKITENNIKSIRPGFGLAPRYFDSILGKKIKKRVERGDPVTKENIDW